jgi:putative tryptophan/tyrosine transport system substrate-binding protein
MASLMIEFLRPHRNILLLGLCAALSFLFPFANSIASPPLLQLAQANPDQLKKQNLLTGDSIAVLYPETNEAAREIFTKIIEGIEAQAKTKVRTIVLTDKNESPEIYSQLKKAGAKVVIALGGRSVKISLGFERDIAVVVGGVLAISEAENRQFLGGIALTPDPGLLFKNVKELIPSMKRVIVIHDPKKSDWLLKFARLAAKEQGIELVVHEAQDLATAARLYETVFNNADPKTDTLWLPQDETTVDESTILPIVLKESWAKNVPFFSSKFIHVRKGALFSLRPNNLELGRNLAVIAMNILAGDVTKRGMTPLKDVQTALNLRTASHIGLNIGSQQQRNFNYIFPEP